MRDTRIEVIINGMGDLLKRGFICLLLTFTVVFSITSADGAEVSLEKELRSDYIGIKSPNAYGTVVMDRYTGEGKAMKSVVFPHWVHRTKFTCKVCHNDMGFPMKAGASDIKMAETVPGEILEGLLNRAVFRNIHTKGVAAIT